MSLHKYCLTVYRFSGVAGAVGLRAAVPVSSARQGRGEIKNAAGREPCGIGGAPPAEQNAFWSNSMERFAVLEVVATV